MKFTGQKVKDQGHEVLKLTAECSTITGERMAILCLNFVHILLNEA